MMTSICLLAPNGNLGSGFLTSSLERAIAEGPDVICCDSGSTDGGPYYLGSGSPYFGRALYERDLNLILTSAKQSGIPLIIGSCAGSGSNGGVDFIADIVGAIARKHRLNIRLARIYSEQTKEYVLKRLEQAKITPLWPSEDLAPVTIERAERIVGMMGPEPIRAALEAGADVVLAGRASDSALFAAYPAPGGFSLGPLWHAGKILECGAAATVHRLMPDCMLGRVYDDHFDVWSPNPDMTCSTTSVSAHTLYESSDPFRLAEPGGTLVTDRCRYEDIGDGRIRVHGSHFEPADAYTVKLEAVEPVGYMSMAIAGIRDPFIVAGLDEFLEETLAQSQRKVADTLGLRDSDYVLKVSVYGRDAVLGARERTPRAGHEVGLLMKAVAATQEAADSIVSIVRYFALHNPVPHWTGMVTNLASPQSPEVIPRGLAYRFSMNHVVEPDDPTEMFSTRIEEL